jgi:hypothetical protein
MNSAGLTLYIYNEPTCQSSPRYIYEVNVDFSRKCYAVGFPPLFWIEPVEWSKNFTEDDASKYETFVDPECKIKGPTLGFDIKCLNMSTTETTAYIHTVGIGFIQPSAVKDEGRRIKVHLGLVFLFLISALISMY